MADAMVTGRMSAAKKQRGGRILSNEGLSASQAVNLMYDRIISEGTAEFLSAEGEAPHEGPKWSAAARFVDSLPCAQGTRFDGMGKGEIRRERLASRGLL